jgi:hypothetical protein
MAICSGERGASRHLEALGREETFTNLVLDGGVAPRRGHVLRHDERQASGSRGSCEVRQLTGFNGEFWAGFGCRIVGRVSGSN